jgi:hypothetical protein
VSKRTMRMLSQRVAATRHHHEILRMRIYRFASWGRFLVCGQYTVPTQLRIMSDDGTKLVLNPVTNCTK